MILGHEGAGTVLAVGSEVTRVRPGDRVIASFQPACGNCWFCLHEQSQLCDGQVAVAAACAPKGTLPDGTPVPGFTGLGTFAEEMLVDESAVVPVRTDLPSDQLALIGCAVTTGVGAALNTAQVDAGVDRRGDRLRRRRPVGGPGRAHRRRGADLRRRSRRDEARDGRAARRHRPRRPGRRRPGRAGEGRDRRPRAPTTRSR